MSLVTVGSTSVFYEAVDIAYIICSSVYMLMQANLLTISFAIATTSFSLSS